MIHDFIVPAVNAIGVKILENLPSLIVLAATFTVVGLFASACNPGPPWWRKPGLVTDCLYMLILPLITGFARVSFLVIGAALIIAQWYHPDLRWLRLLGSDLSIGWAAVLLSAYNFVRWWSIRSYLAQRRVTQKMLLATTAQRGKAELSQALADESTSLWPEAHFLAPLHPVVDWASDRALVLQPENQLVGGCTSS